MPKVIRPQFNVQLGYLDLFPDSYDPYVHASPLTVGSGDGGISRSGLHVLEHELRTEDLVVKLALAHELLVGAHRGDPAFVEDQN